MKTKKSIVCFGLFLILIILVFSPFMLRKDKNIFALESKAYGKDIYESGDISEELFNALREFYNANKEDGAYSYTDYINTKMFVGFSKCELDLSQQNISSIKNLSEFDLSAFTTINLSNNKLDSLGGEFTNIEGVLDINLSNNEIYSFNYKSLCQDCYDKIQRLDLSNNRIAQCDISAIKSGEINLSNNMIVSSKLSLPLDGDAKINLSFNLLDFPETINSNYIFGFQGATNNQSLKKGQEVWYSNLDDVSGVNIYLRGKKDYSGNEQQEGYDESSLVLFHELDEGEILELPLGYYRIEFLNDALECVNDIEFKIEPIQPEIKMYSDGEEVELSHEINKDVTLKFSGTEGSLFVYTINGSKLNEGSELLINQEGVMNIVVYQVEDGYLSSPTTFYLSYQKSSIKGWIFVLCGTAIFVSLFYLIIKFAPKLTSIGLGGEEQQKKNLD